MNPLRSLYLVDGENLVARFQAMKAAGWRVRQPGVVHMQDVLVWAPVVIHDVRHRVVRATYYASVVGDTDEVRKAQATIKGLTYTTYLDRIEGGCFHHSVFKRPSKSYKSRAVDIRITIDALRHCYQDDIDVLYLVTGDADFLPLIHTVMRLGKQVNVLSFSSGLADALTHEADTHSIIDQHFFTDPPPNTAGPA